MSGYVIILASFMLSLPEEKEPWPLSSPWGGRFLEDYAAVCQLAQFDLGSIPEKEAHHWAVLELIPSEDELTKEDLDLVLTPGKEEKEEVVLVKQVKWKWICSLSGMVPKGKKTQGKTIWGENLISRTVCRFSEGYDPIVDGAVVLAEFYPDKKKGEFPFGEIIVVSENVAKWIPPAYQFRLKHPEFFGKEFREKELLELLRHENPMIAIQSLQRLVKEKPLDREALKIALEGPADFRRPIAIYLYFSFVGKDPSEIEFYQTHPQAEGYVPPELEAAIQKADIKLLRWYMIGITGAVVEQTGVTTSARTALKKCRERALHLSLTKELRKELNRLLGRGGKLSLYEE